MTPTDPDQPRVETASDALVRDVVQAYRLGALRSLRHPGGTASRKWLIDTTAGAFFVRVRPSQFADDPQTTFDHACLQRLHAGGLPVPKLMARADGATWLDTQSGRVEVFASLTGEPFAGTPHELEALGAMLAALHRPQWALPPGKWGGRREDHADLLADYLKDLAPLATAAEKDRLVTIAREIARVQQHLDRGLYDALPTALIHGDVHPGNVRFGPRAVAALYDFDYLAPQARVRDLVDGLMFFARSMPGRLDPDDIGSLTAPFQIECDAAAALLRGYLHRAPRLKDVEWQAIPWLIRSRWLQTRLRGARKIPAARRIAFVLDGLEIPLQWLDREADRFLDRLRRQTATSS